MMDSRRRTSRGYAGAAMTSLLVVGLLYVGVLLLNDARRPWSEPAVEGAIRLSTPPPERAEPEQRRVRPKEMEPPKRLPRTVSTRPKRTASAPMPQLSAPSFSPEMRPGLAGDIALPLGDLGDAGFSLDEVDEAPAPLRSVPPQYPYSAKRNRIQGEVTVRMLVTSQGRPTNLSIHSATPKGVFEQAALAAAKRWTFRPGRYQGRDVDTWVLLPFRFELER